MAGGALKFRHLNRKSSHRQALLRNLVTSLITHESIKTTWPKAKEAQRLAEKLITLGKKNTNASRAKAESIFFVRWVPFYIYPSLDALFLAAHGITDERMNPGAIETSTYSIHNPSTTLSEQAGRLYPRPAHRTSEPQQRPSALRHPRTRRRAP